MKFSIAIKKFEDWKRLQSKPTTVLAFSCELRACCLFLRDPEVESITAIMVLEYLEALKALGWKHNTVASKCNYLRGFFRFLRLQGGAVLDENLIPKPSYQYKLPRVATAEEYKKLCAAIPGAPTATAIRARALFGLLWDTGARVGEIVSLNVEDLDLDRSRAVVRTEKSRTSHPYREIFWTPETNEHLHRWLEKRKRLPILAEHRAALFTSIAGCDPHKRLSTGGVAQMLRSLCVKAGVGYLRPHSFRHHLGHEIINQGGSASDVMNILGHSNLSSTAIYTMMTDRELEARYRAINGR
jgi:site-specific recombinase XerD